MSDAERLTEQARVDAWIADLPSPHEDRRGTGLGNPYPPRIQIKFVPADLWLGVYVGPVENASGWSEGYIYRKVYVCLIPCFPVIFTKRLALH